MSTYLIYNILLLLFSQILQFRYRILIGCSLCFLLILSAIRYKGVIHNVLPSSIRTVSLRSYLSKPETSNNNHEIDDRKVLSKKFKYTINEDTICKETNKTSVSLLVGVFSGLTETPLRNFVRSKWGAVAKRSPKVRLVFILGTPEGTSNDMKSVQEESKLHGDVIQANFTDTYRGLLLKSFAYFKWAQDYCDNAKYLLKIDSDMQIDLMQLVTVLEKGNISDRFHCGEMNTDSYPVRNKNNKWYVSPQMFPGRKFPFYCQGAAYVISKRIANKIADLPIPNKFFPIDDVYMTGILRETLKEDIEHKIMRFHHHYKATDTKVTEGKFSKFIMTIHVADDSIEKQGKKNDGKA
ncbi:hypothetical protein FSP39_023210 [Pinctada imbricata]|uniref:Hexosyltransferase n=1 Tax=Pinctada imbricata TaxID=66713 RepID=A0AA89C8F9_PINIB|nr:hypothetical protein FSP39_023210 [Pinctada imbricata]